VYVVHTTYIKKVRQYLEESVKTPAEIEKIMSYLREIFTITSLNLDPVAPLLKSLYRNKSGGRPCREPLSMLRSLLLMTLLNEASITEWVTQLKRQEILCILSGFAPGNPPGVATFYSFLDRLQDGPYEKPCKHVHKLSDLDKKRHRRNLKEEKKKPEEDFSGNDTVTGKLSKELISHEKEKRQEDLQKRLEDIFMVLAILPSARAGLLGDLSRLDIVGDGSCLPSGANRYGKPTCNCFKEGIKKCNCDRLYTDPDADWGWDSYHEEYYFGDRLYQYCYTSGRHNLPLIVTCGPASESDYTLSLKSFDRMMKTFIEHNFNVKITGVGLDKGHDAMGIYQYFLQKSIPVAIPLNNRGKANPYQEEMRISKNGKPVCKGGLEMRYHCYDKKKMRHCYNCPVKRPTRTDGHYHFVAHIDECPNKALCNPESTMGPIVYISSKDNPRLYPQITRDSDRYKEFFNDRTGTERSNSFKKVTYPLDRARCKSRAHRLIRLFLISIIEHRKVLTRTQTKDFSKDMIFNKAMENMIITDS
jgi:hypothetical protein